MVLSPFGAHRSRFIRAVLQGRELRFEFGDAGVARGKRLRDIGRVDEVDAADVAQALAVRDARIAKLEAELAALQGRPKINRDRCAPKGLNTIWVRYVDFEGSNIKAAVIPDKATTTARERFCERREHSGSAKHRAQDRNADGKALTRSSSLPRPWPSAREAQERSPHSTVQIRERGTDAYHEHSRDRERTRVEGASERAEITSDASPTAMMPKAVVKSSFHTSASASRPPIGGTSSIGRVAASSATPANSMLIRSPVFRNSGRWTQHGPVAELDGGQQRANSGHGPRCEYTGIEQWTQTPPLVPAKKDRSRGAPHQAGGFRHKGGIVPQKRRGSPSQATS